MSDSPRVLGNRYEIGDLLGRGGMAEVHLGRDTRLGRPVAIKLLRTDLARDPTFQARFRREAQSAAGLNHPSIVAVYDTGEEQIVDAGGATVPLPYIVMEYVQGRTARALIEQARVRTTSALPAGTPAPPAAGALDVAVALEITAGVLSALEYSHAHGIVHRDIKPANVMITPKGDVKVMDFGIARAVTDASATMTQTQAVIGTAQYLSPEQARGETVDARSDLYSCGCLLYELLTGRPPFVADSPVAVAYQHVREVPQPPSTVNPRIPESVDRVVMHALTKDREARYQSAREFHDDVEAVRLGQPARVAAGAVAGAVDPSQARTAYLGAAAPTAATVAVPPAGGTSVMPGVPAEPDDPFGRPYRGGYQTAAPPPEKRNRTLGYVALGIAVLLVFGLIGLAMAKLGGGGGDGASGKVSVPDLSRLTEDQAKSQLAQDGLKYSATEVPSDTIDKGLVVSQSPEAEQLVTKGSVVTVRISTGPESIKVPNLEGMSQSDARKALTDAGLRAGDQKREDDPDFDADTVIRTEPAAGEKVEPDSEITLVLASGLVDVPNVVGLDVNAARKKIGDSDLKTKNEYRDSPAKENTVIEQNPSGGKVQAGTTVTIVVAQKAAPTPTLETTAPGTPSPSVTPTDQNGNTGNGNTGNGNNNGNNNGNGGQQPGPGKGD